MTEDEVATFSGAMTAGASNVNLSTGSCTEWDIVTLLASGKAPPLVSKYLAGGNLTALNKLKEGSANDIRPIAVGEVLRRLTGKCLCTLTKHTDTEFFQPLQLGVACPSGTEKVIHGLRTCMEEHWEDDDFAVVKVDMRNAFNLVSRQALLDQCAIHFPELLPWTSWCYGSHPLLWNPLGHLSSQSGVQQGDPLGPLFFSLVLRKITMAIATDDDCLALLFNAWFLDDDTALDQLGNHATTCKRGEDVVSRHNRLRDLVLEFCRRATQVLTYLLALDWDRGRHAAFDVTITSPLSVSILPEASISVGAAALEAEVRKHRVNDPKCSELGWVCVALAVETYSNWGKEAQATFSRLAACIATTSSCHKSQVLGEMYGRLNFTLVRAISRAILAAYAAAPTDALALFRDMGRVTAWSMWILSGLQNPDEAKEAMKAAEECRAMRTVHKSPMGTPRMSRFGRRDDSTTGGKFYVKPQVWTKLFNKVQCTYYCRPLPCKDSIIKIPRFQYEVETVVIYFYAGKRTRQIAYGPVGHLAVLLTENLPGP
eukprot:Em0003g1723a